MKLLEDRILRDGEIYPGDILKVDSFVNHQIDVPFMCELAKEYHRLFSDRKVTKILTIEASGIGIACLTAQVFGVPVLFAKKSRTLNQSSDVYSSTVFSYTHKTENHVTVSKQYLLPTDRVLIIDDFLATGNALFGLTDLCKQAGSEVVGIGTVIEKTYQGGGNKLRELGYDVQSLAMIKSMTDDGKIEFC